MEHHHYFEPSSDGTLMRDFFSYESPLGIFGRIAEFFFLDRYMRSLLVERNRVIKATAESNAWPQYFQNVSSNS
jgi:ligand-binding SRPBCC domain-containing protein